MAIATLVLELLFVALAFGVRSWVHRRRTGSFGYRGLSGRPFSIEWLGGVLFLVAIVLALAAPLVALGDAPPFAAGSFIRAVPLIAGTIGTVHAQLAMGDSWRVGVAETERTALIRSGPFRLIRNPIFTWMIVAVGGVFAMLLDVTSAMALVALVAAIEIQVRLVEEPHLMRVHGADYRAYAATTGRFVPRVGRLARTD